jgi:hypothetical protein
MSDRELRIWVRAVTKATAQPYEIKVDTGDYESVDAARLTVRLRDLGRNFLAGEAGTIGIAVGNQVFKVKRIQASNGWRFVHTLGGAPGEPSSLEDLIRSVVSAGRRLGLNVVVGQEPLEIRVWQINDGSTRTSAKG